MDKQLRDMSMLFQALTDPTRLRILGLLLTGEVCVCHIHETLKVPQSKASRHLAYLRRNGLVTTRVTACGFITAFRFPTTRWSHRSDSALSSSSRRGEKRSDAFAQEDRLLRA